MWQVKMTSEHAEMGKERGWSKIAGERTLPQHERIVMIS